MNPSVRRNDTKDKTMRKLLLIAAGAALAAPALAAEVDLDGTTVTLNNKLSFGAAWRMEERDPNLVGWGNGGMAYSTNTDDGNLAFDKGDLIAETGKLTSDLSISRGEFGLFVRGSALYSPLLWHKSYFDQADYLPTPGKEQDASERDYKNETVEKHVGSDFDLLDAYVFGRFTLGDRGLNLKVGRQVLNWGESTFVQHGLNALLAADVNQLRVPGFEVEEVQIPVGMAVVSIDVVDNVTFEGFYQYEWHPTIIDASGTYFSTNDVVGLAGTQANIGFGRVGENSDNQTTCNPAPPAPNSSKCVQFGSTVPRAPDREPSNDGQFGGKLSLYVPWLNDADVGLYAAQYHSRLPLTSGTSRTTVTSAVDTATYFIEYPENIKLYGVSFNTTVPWVDIALQGEYSYKQDQPLQLEDVELLLNGLGVANQINPTPGGSLGGQYLRGWRRHDVSQVDLGFTKIIGPHMGFDQLTVLFEGAYVYVHGMEKPEELAYEAPGTYTFNSGTANLTSSNQAAAAGLPVTPYSAYATPSSWGYKIAARETYNNVFGIFNVEPTVLFQHDVSGITPAPIVNFVEDRKQVNFILGVDYLQQWNFSVGYGWFFGGGAQNLLSDRDYLDASIKYSF